MKAGFRFAREYCDAPDPVRQTPCVRSAETAQQVLEPASVDRRHQHRAIGSVCLQSNVINY
jgi:hypothetical protein